MTSYLTKKVTLSPITSSYLEILMTVLIVNLYTLNAFLLPYSNGFTEGYNNKTKVLKRNSYGVCHFGRFRARLLMILPSIYSKPYTPTSVAT